MSFSVSCSFPGWFPSSRTQCARAGACVCSGRSSPPASAFWFSYQLFWTYYEVWLRADVPDLCAADIVLFLHIVPLMAALALRPHAPQDEYAARLRRLDFALMMVWWAYLYVLIVIPWQYVVANATGLRHQS